MKRLLALSLAWRAPAPSRRPRRSACGATSTTRPANACRDPHHRERGRAHGQIEKRLAKDAKPDAVCDECTDDRKGKPMVGLEIIRGARKAEGKDVWEGGKILDPENGRDYRCA